MPMPRIAGAEGRSEGLVLRWDNGTESHFPWFWLRDHGQDPDSLDPATLQRRVDTFALDEAIRAKASVVLEDGQALAVTWPGQGPDKDTESRYSADFLATMAGLSAPGPAPRLWSAGSGLPAIEPVP